MKKMSILSLKRKFRRLKGGKISLDAIFGAVFNVQFRPVSRCVFLKGEKQI